MLLKDSVLLGADMTVALITGTSTGIGLATALHLARNKYFNYKKIRTRFRSAVSAHHFISCSDVEINGDISPLYMFLRFFRM